MRISISCFVGAVTKVPNEEQENAVERRYFLAKCDKKRYNKIIKGVKTKEAGDRHDRKEASVQTL